MTWLINRLIAAVMALALVPLGWAAQAQDIGRVYDQRQIEQDLAPIALYPDTLLAQILMASTYPDEVDDADRWVHDPQNAALRGDQLADALDQIDWDPSVKALVPFPQILEMMNRQRDWSERVGEEFIAQEDDVMDAVQRLRAQAAAAGTLRSDERLAVRYDGPTIIIEPVDPDIVYVPYYDARYAYGDWVYPDYPPVYFPPPAGYVGGLYYYAGWPIVRPLWGWSNWDWHRHRIVIHRDRYIALNFRRQPYFRGDDWRHDVYHRRGADYRVAQVRRAFERGAFGRRDPESDRRFQEARRFDNRRPFADRNRPDSNRFDNRRPFADRTPDFNRNRFDQDRRFSPNRDADRERMRERLQNRFGGFERGPNRNFERANREPQNDFRTRQAEPRRQFEPRSFDQRPQFQDRRFDNNRPEQQRDVFRDQQRNRFEQQQREQFQQRQRDQQRERFQQEGRAQMFQQQQRAQQFQQRAQEQQQREQYQRQQFQQRAQEQQQRQQYQRQQFQQQQREQFQQQQRAQQFQRREAPQQRAQQFQPQQQQRFQRNEQVGQQPGERRRDFDRRDRG